MLADAFDSDMRSIMADLPQEMTVSRPGRRSFTVPCAASDLGGTRSAQTEARGYEYEDSVSVSYLAADCPWLPEPGDRVKVSGSARQYRIAALRRMAGDAAVTAQLEAAR